MQDVRDAAMPRSRPCNTPFFAQVARAIAALTLLCGLLSATAAAEVRYFHTDALGSVVAVTDENGNVIERREYEPYGKQLIPVVQDGPGYTGHVQDAATGLTYMQQRYYDPEIGAFLSVDPVTVDQTTGWNFCRYCYAANNPYKFKDPDGRIIDTVVDVGFLVYDVYKIATEGATSENMAALTADAAGLVIPGATGLGLGVRAAGHGADALKAADNVADATRAARPADGVSMSTDDALDTAVSYLGDGYKQIDSGVYRSADGTRQVRMTDRDLNHPRQEPHMNFEEGQTVPNHRGTSTFEAEHNSHVYLPEEKL